MTRIFDMAFKELNKSDTPTGLFGLGMAILAVAQVQENAAEQQKRIADALDQIASKRRLEALEEIRDQARAGLRGLEIEQAVWDKHRLAKIANMAELAIEGEG